MTSIAVVDFFSLPGVSVSSRRVLSHAGRVAGGDFFEGVVGMALHGFSVVRRGRFVD